MVGGEGYARWWEEMDDTCNSRPSFIHDFRMRAASEYPILSEGATGPALMVLMAACSRVKGSVTLPLYGLPGCRGHTNTAQAPSKLYEQTKPSKSEVPSKSEAQGKKLPEYQWTWRRGNHNQTTAHTSTNTQEQQGRRTTNTDTQTQSSGCGTGMKIKICGSTRKFITAPRTSSCPEQHKQKGGQGGTNT